MVVVVLVLLFRLSSLKATREAHDRVTNRNRDDTHHNAPTRCSIAILRSLQISSKVIWVDDMTEFPAPQPGDHTLQTIAELAKEKNVPTCAALWRSASFHAPAPANHQSSRCFGSPSTHSMVLVGLSLRPLQTW
ncbi:hypothetical protein BDZ45DRAFT_758354 [Acephala macrosclerotiorum]|nr:hypothetical protein BDZ45DRAFT_758354 [Acephala macrosclerotiorum]